MIDNYKDLTLEKYIELQSVDWSTMEEIDIQATMISILADIDLDSVLDLPISEYKKLANKLDFLKKEPNAKPKKINTLKINGKEFKVLDKIEDMTAGQYIDYRTYLQKKDVKMLPYILSCIITPKGKKYGEEDCVNDIMQLSVEEALMISNFFTKKSRTLIRAMLLSLEWTMKKKAKKMKDETMKMQMMEAIKQINFIKDLTKNGDGYLALIQYLQR